MESNATFIGLYNHTGWQTEELHNRLFDWPQGHFYIVHIVTEQVIEMCILHTGYKFISTTQNRNPDLLQNSSPAACLGWKILCAHAIYTQIISLNKKMF